MHKSKECMMEEKYRRLIDFLHSTNTGDYVQLPQIVVVGDTSSGKSSLLSALAQIQFPVNDTITTRCPIRLHMEKKSSCSDVAARVDISWNSSTKSHPVWKIIEMCTTAAIPKAIEEAQQCILSAIDSSHGGKREVAKDVVEVYLVGPNLIDLAIIDLPGLVQATGKGESESLVSEILSLVTGYIQNNRCVILAVQPANVDFHNSRTLSLALSVDPHRKRTIPVITKPDLVDPGSENEATELLLGNRTSSYALGFHMIKCRGKQAVTKGISLQEAEQEEMHFFRNTIPWNGIHASFVGTSALREKLYCILANMVQAEIPSIRREIQTKLTMAKRELAVLGPDPDHPSIKKSIWHSIEMNTLNCLKGEIEGSSSTRSFPLLKKRAANNNAQTHPGEEQMNSATSSEGDSHVTPNSITWCAKCQQMYKRYGSEMMQGTLATITTLQAGSSVVVHFPNGDITAGVVVKVWEQGDFVFVRPAVVHGSVEEDDRFFTERNKSCIITQHTSSDGKRRPPHEGDISEDMDGFSFIVRHVKHSQSHATSSPASTGVAAVASANSNNKQQSKPYPQPTATGMPPPTARMSATAMTSQQLQQQQQQTILEYHCTVDVLAAFHVSDVRRSSDWLIEPIQQSLTNDLPCFLSPHVFNTIVRSIVESEWKPLTLQLCHDIIGSLHETASRIVSNCVPQHYQRLRQHLLVNVCDNIINVIGKQECENQLEVILGHECTPFTQNDKMFEAIMANRLASLKKRLTNTLITSLTQLSASEEEDKENLSRAILGGIGGNTNFRNGSFMSPQKLSKSSAAASPKTTTASTSRQQQQPISSVPQMIIEQQEFTVMESLATRVSTTIDDVFKHFCQQPMQHLLADDALVILDAYGAIASQRMVDNIPMFLVSHCKNAIYEGVVERMHNISTDEALLKELLKEDDAAKCKRQRLEATISTLSAAEAAINHEFS